MQAKDVIERARIILQDAGADYWEQSELPKWLTDGRMQAYDLRPVLYESTDTVSLVGGAVQEVPGGSRYLFEVIKNVSHFRQRRITLVEDETLSRHRPMWRSSTPAQEILHYLYNTNRPGQFEVYPPARDGVTVEVSYAKIPVEIATYNSETELKEEGTYAQALVDYVLYRAFLKEADTVPAFHERAAQHYLAFQSALTGTVSVANPNRE